MAVVFTVGSYQILFGAVVSPQHARVDFHRHDIALSKATVGEWDGETLAALPSAAIRNAYPYVWASHFKTEKVGFSGQTGARATISLPAAKVTNAGTPHKFILEAIDGAVWKTKIQP